MGRLGQWVRPVVIASTVTLLSLDQLVRDRIINRFMNRSMGCTSKLTNCAEHMAKPKKTNERRTKRPATSRSHPTNIQRQPDPGGTGTANVEGEGRCDNEPGSAGKRSECSGSVRQTVRQAPRPQKIAGSVKSIIGYSKAGDVDGADWHPIFEDDTKNHTDKTNG